MQREIVVVCDRMRCKGTSKGPDSWNGSQCSKSAELGSSHRIGTEGCSSGDGVSAASSGRESEAGWSGQKASSDGAVERKSMQAQSSFLLPIV